MCLLLFTELMILIGLVYSYYQLVKLLKEYHTLRYLEVRIQLTFFMLTEIIPLSLDIVYLVISILYSSTSVIPDEVHNFVNTFDAYLWTIYPVLQAFGMLVLKDSKDPISGISKLKCILIYSINQITLSSFKAKIK